MTERRRVYLTLIAMTLAPVLGVPLILFACSILHGCAASNPASSRHTIPLSHGGTLEFTDVSLNSDGLFASYAALPATHALNTPDPLVYRCTPSSTSAEVRAEIKRELEAWIAAYPMAYSVTVQRYSANDVLSSRVRIGGLWHVHLSWFVHSGRIVTEDTGWELRHAWRNADDGTPLFDQDQQAEAQKNLRAP